jgi:hypothetical protein
MRVNLGPEDLARDLEAVGAVGIAAAVRKAVTEGSPIGSPEVKAQAAKLEAERAEREATKWVPKSWR